MHDRVCFNNIIDNLEFPKKNNSLKKNVDLSVVIPLFNSQKTIKILIDRTILVLRKLNLLADYFKGKLIHCLTGLWADQFIGKLNCR